MKKLIESSYVVVKLDVLEQGEKKSLENPGGVDVLAALKGKTAGLPFMAVTDSAGKMLVNSNSQTKGEAGNIGYPAAPHEIDWFIGMLSTSSKLTAPQKAEIKAWLQRNAPKM